MSNWLLSPEQSNLLDYWSPGNVLAIPEAHRPEYYVVTMARSVTSLAHFLVLIFTGLLAFRDEVLPLSSVSPANFSGLTEDCDPSMPGILPQIT